MTEQIEITLAELSDGIKEIFALSEQALQDHPTGAYGKDINILVKLNEKNPLCGHIEVMLSIRVARDGTKLRMRENLSIRNISITDKDAIEGLDIRSPNGVIRKASLENIEFHYSEDNDCIITVDGCFSVELIKCTAVNCGELMLKYNMPDKNTIGHEIIVRDCRFKDFYVKAGYHKEEDESSQDTGNKYKVNLYMEFDGNVFPLFTLKLSESTVIGYKYGYNAKLVRGNDIEEIIIEDEYPDVIAWSSHEKIGEKITKGFYAKTETERYQRDKNGISAIRRAREKMDGNKAVLMRFRKFAEDKGDRYQESTVNYHIAKCDEQIVELGGWKGSIQNKLIMISGRELSYHGTSWIFPLVWISIFNLAMGIIIFAILDSMHPLLIRDLDFWYIFRELHNPFNTPLSIVQGINTKFNYDFLGRAYLWISFFALLSKGFYAMCIYEFIRAARRFTLK